MSELTCDVVFYKNVNYGYVSCTNVEVGKPLGDHFLEDSVEIGRLPSVTIELKDDITEEKIDALRNQKQKVAAEAQG